MTLKHLGERVNEETNVSSCFSIAGFGATNTSASVDSTTTSSASNNSQQQQQVQHPQQTFNHLAATNAFAAHQQMPPGYAYYFGNMGLQAPAAYAGAATGPTPGATHVYPPTAMTVPGAGATATSQFQKSYGTK